MSYQLRVFVSSTCYELRDLRAAVAEFLESLGATPLLSDASGFPAHPGMPPYASCLKALEDCTLVVGVVDRQYGAGFDDWGPYPQHAGLSPTHAEIRHALESGKRILLFFHRDTWALYESWRKGCLEQDNLPKGMEIATLELLKELKLRQPAPWIEQYSDVRDVLRSLRKNVINEVYTALREREERSRDVAAFLLKEIQAAAPEVKTLLAERLSPDLISRLNELEDANARLQELKDEASTSGREDLKALEGERQELQAKADKLESMLSLAQLHLVKAALRDVDWLTMVRTRLMPQQPTRVPFHHAKEIAIRGYHPRSMEKPPVLKSVRWSVLPRKEGGLSRGYGAALILEGADFAPGCTYASRRSPADKLFWRLPNTYFGDYLEVSTNSREDETPIGMVGTEYCVRNPLGQESGWVPFNPEFDWDAVVVDLENSRTTAQNPDEVGIAKAIEAARHGWVLARAVHGEDSAEASELSGILESLRDQRALAQMRFCVGENVQVHEGEHKGERGVIAERHLRSTKHYQIALDSGSSVWVSDSEVEPVDSSMSV